MKAQLRRGTFPEDEVERLDARAHVVLASGGPRMRVVRAQGEDVTCEWDGQAQIFGAACLRTLAPFDSRRFVP